VLCVQERVIKFVNYFLSRKHVQSVQNACALFAVLKTFATNEVRIDTLKYYVTFTKQIFVIYFFDVFNCCRVFVQFHNPIAVSLASQVAVSDKVPVVKV
jgi:hypothetical protein